MRGGGCQLFWWSVGTLAEARMSRRWVAGGAQPDVEQVRTTRRTGRIRGKSLLPR